MLSQTSESPVSWQICQLMWHKWLISVCKAKATPKHLKLRMIFLAFPFDPPLVRGWQNSIVHGKQCPQGHSRPWSLLLIWSLMADHIPWEKLTLLHTFFIPSAMFKKPSCFFCALPRWSITSNVAFATKQNMCHWCDSQCSKPIPSIHHPPDLGTYLTKGLRANAPKAANLV